MWYDHLISMPNFSFGTVLVLMVTWPYHRTFRYFTLDPATKLAKDLGRESSELARSINHWRISKEQEYDFVMNASTLAAIADISVFSWTEFGDTYWLASAFFYFSLSLSLWAVILSAQQKSVTRTLAVYHPQQESVTHALTVHQDSPRQLRFKVQVILRIPDVARYHAGRRRTFAELNMLYVWQSPLMLMSYGWATLLVGLTLYVCSPLISESGQDKRKVAIFYLVTGGALFINFVWSSAWSFWLPKITDEVDREAFRNSVADVSAPSTRASTLWIHKPESPAGQDEKVKGDISYPCSPLSSPKPPSQP